MLARVNPIDASAIDDSSFHSDAAAVERSQPRPLATVVPESRHRQAVAARLVRRCADGDHDALAALFELFSGLLLRMARAIVWSDEEAEDVVQEVFLYAWQRAERYDPRRAGVSTWLGQIARSRSIDRLRKASSVERTRSGVAQESASSVEPRAEQEILTQQRRERLRGALEALPAAQREAVVLAYYDDMTQSEIAAQGEIPLGTVKTRTFLAMRKLRAELAPEAAGLR